MLVCFSCRIFFSKNVVVVAPCVFWGVVQPRRRRKCWQLLPRWSIPTRRARLDWSMPTQTQKTPCRMWCDTPPTTGGRDTKPPLRSTISVSGFYSLSSSSFPIPIPPCLLSPGPESYPYFPHLLFGSCGFCADQQRYIFFLPLPSSSQSSLPSSSSLLSAPHHLSQVDESSEVSRP